MKHVVLLRGWFFVAELGRGGVPGRDMVTHDVTKRELWVMVGSVLMAVAAGYFVLVSVATIYVIGWGSP